MLIVDGDRSLRVRTAELLREQGHDVSTAVGVSDAVMRGDAEPFELVVLGAHVGASDLQSE